MTQAIYATAAEAKETKAAKLNADVERLCAELKLSACERQVFAGHFADLPQRGVDQTRANIRTTLDSLRATRSGIAHLPNCKCKVGPRRKSALEALGLDHNATV